MCGMYTPNQPSFMKVTPIFLITICLLFTGKVHSQVRDFTSTTGQTIKAEILFVQGTNVILKKSGSKNFTVPISRFTSADQSFIEKWEKKNAGKPPAHLKNKKPRMTIVVSTGKTNKDDDRESGYVDEHKQKVQMKVELENNDAIYPIQNATLTVMVIGQSPETKKNAIVSKEIFKKIDLPLNQKRSYEGKPFELWYDDYGAMYGHKWKGYIVALQDSEGKILGEKTIPGSAAKYIDAALSLKSGDVFDNKYSKRGTVSLKMSVRGR